MQRALMLARRGAGKTSPNPVVGAVLVRNGKVIGEGWHRRAGAPHAEVEAIRNAGWIGRKRSSKAAPTFTLYVTLEPCCTFGRTPPCTDAILAAGIRCVVIAARDPNPRHNGRGIRILKRAGLQVEDGLFSEEATRLNEAFNKWIATGHAIGDCESGDESRWKNRDADGRLKVDYQPNARQTAHQLRANVDAILVGANTVIRDDPHLTVRRGVRVANQPWRVVVDARG